MRLGKRKQAAYYERIDAGEVAVYYQAQVAERFATVTIRLEGFWFIRWLVAAGS